MNNFKAGDRVRIYGFCILKADDFNMRLHAEEVDCATGTIVGLIETPIRRLQVKLDRDRFNINGYQVHHVHPKQCRKLVKKERKFAHKEIVCFHDKKYVVISQSLSSCLLANYVNGKLGGICCVPHKYLIKTNEIYSFTCPLCKSEDGDILIHQQLDFKLSKKDIFDLKYFCSKCLGIPPELQSELQSDEPSTIPDSLLGKLNSGFCECLDGFKPNGLRPDICVQCIKPKKSNPVPKAKFKEGDFVYHNSHLIGIVLRRNYLFGFHWDVKFNKGIVILEESYLRKLNINIED